MAITLLYVVLTITLILFVPWLLWQLRVIMPVRLVSKIKAVKKYYVSEWAGEGSGRYKQETEYGSLWWGYNTKTRHEFVIFNGKIGHESFQFQNWRPRIAFWGK